MKGARQVVSKPLLVTWELATVLKIFSELLFEPLDQLDLNELSLKMAMLLAPVSAQHISDIHALSVNPSYMQFL